MHENGLAVPLAVYFCDVRNLLQFAEEIYAKRPEFIALLPRRSEVKGDWKHYKHLLNLQTDPFAYEPFGGENAA